MNDYLIHYIQRRIDKKILNALVLNPLISVGSMLLNEVIYPQLLTDLNLVGGRQVKLELTEDMVYNISEDELILLIPPEHRKYSNIKSVSLLHTNRHFKSHTNYDNYIPKTALVDTKGMFDEYNTTSGISMETELTVIGNRYISIKQKGISISYIQNCVVTFDVQYSKNMDGIDDDYYPEFGKLALLATKMYVYNELCLSLDEAFILNNQLSEKLIQRIDSYSDAEVLYDDSMDRLGKFSTLNNKDEMRDLIRFQV